MQRPRVMPPVYLLIAVVAMLALHFLVPIRHWIAWPWRWLGVLPATVGLVIGGWTATILVRRKTTIKPGEVSSQLVKDGPFRWSRNPIYLGMGLLLAGVALLLGSASPWFVLPLFLWQIGARIIPVEEAILAQTFGEDYLQYKNQVRRWI